MSADIITTDELFNADTSRPKLNDILTDYSLKTEGLNPGQTPLRISTDDPKLRAKQLSWSTIHGVPIDWQAWKNAPPERKNFFYVPPDRVPEAIHNQWKSYFNNPSRYGFTEDTPLSTVIRKFDQTNAKNKLNLLHKDGIDPSTPIKSLRKKFDLSQLNPFSATEADAAEPPQDTMTTDELFGNSTKDTASSDVVSTDELFSGDSNKDVVGTKELLGDQKIYSHTPITEYDPNQKIKVGEGDKVYVPQPQISASKKTPLDEAYDATLRPIVEGAQNFVNHIKKQTWDLPQRIFNPGTYKPTEFQKYLDKEHPVAGLLGDIAGSAGTATAAALTPEVSLPVAFGSVSVLQGAAEQADRMMANPNEQFKLAKVVGEDAVNASAGALTAGIFSKASAGRTVLDRVLIKSGGAGATAITQSIANQAIVDEKADPVKAVQEGGIQAVTYGIIAGMFEVPQLRGIITKEASNLVGRPVEFKEAKQVLSRAGIDPEQLSPEFQQAIYESKRAIVMDEIKNKSDVYGVSTDIIKQVMADQNIRSREQMLAKYMNSLVVTDPAKAKALLPFYDAIKKGADPVDVLLGQQLAEHLKPGNKIEETVKSSELPQEITDAEGSPIPLKVGPENVSPKMKKAVDENLSKPTEILPDNLKQKINPKPVNPDTQPDRPPEGYDYDLGAIPGEPMWTKKSGAFVTEKEIKGQGILYSAFDQHNNHLGDYESLKDASKAVDHVERQEIVKSLEPIDESQLQEGQQVYVMNSDNKDYFRSGTISSMAKVGKSQKVEVTDEDGKKVWHTKEMLKVLPSEPGMGENNKQKEQNIIPKQEEIPQLKNTNDAEKYGLSIRDDQQKIQNLRDAAIEAGKQNEELRKIPAEQQTDAQMQEAQNSAYKAQKLKESLRVAMGGEPITKALKNTEPQSKEKKYTVGEKLFKMTKFDVVPTRNGIETPNKSEEYSTESGHVLTDQEVQTYKLNKFIDQVENYGLTKVIPKLQYFENIFKKANFSTSDSFKNYLDLKKNKNLNNILQSIGIDEQGLHDLFTNAEAVRQVREKLMKDAGLVKIEPGMKEPQRIEEPNKTLPKQEESAIPKLEVTPNERPKEPVTETKVTAPEPSTNGEPGLSVREPGREPAGNAGNTLESGAERSGRGASSGEVAQQPELIPAQAQEQTSDDVPNNHKILESDILFEGGKKTRFKNNIAAIKLAQKIEEEKRLATHEEKKTLAKYVGWGGLSEAFGGGGDWIKEYRELRDLLGYEDFDSARRSTINAHYTAPKIINTMWKAVSEMGFTRGKVLEPSAGIGHFIGLAPQANKNFTLVELDNITGLIAKHLYAASDVQIKGFQDAQLPTSFFDLLISNVPFSDYKPYDPKAKALGIPSGLVLHDYFFAKSLALTKPGGIVAFITSKGTMDKVDDSFRKYLNENAKFLGAIRLPSNAFKENAGTEVVTDMIFLQKPFPKEEIKNPDFITVAPFSEAKKIDKDFAAQDDSESGGVNINKYFLDNPQNVIGKLGVGSGLYNDRELTVTDNGDFDKKLAEAINSLPKNIYKTVSAYNKDIAETATIEDHTELKNFALTIKDGKPYQKIDNKLEPLDISGDKLKKLSSLISIRDTVRDLLHAERTNAPDTDLTKKRKLLNNAYDAFVKKYGYLNQKKNTAVIEDDPDSPLIESLENVKKTITGTTYMKQPIFKERVIKPHIKPTKANSPVEALNISLAEYGIMNWDYIQSLLDMPQAEVQDSLLKQGLIFIDPASDDFVLKDDYLSGNVKEKLRIAEFASKKDARFNRNIDELKAVIPADLTFDQIYVSVGMPWIEADTYNRFLRIVGGSGKILHNPASGSWEIENMSKYAGFGEYSTNALSAAEIFEKVLNGKPLKVFAKSIDSEGNEVKVLDEQETALAEQKGELMKERFKTWFWEDDDRRDQYVKLYNEKWNNLVTKKYDGSHLVFPSMNQKAFPKGFRKTQLDAIWRGITSTRLMLAHAVGAGKTAIGITTIMESKRLGILNKAMVVAPKNVVPGWRLQTNNIYPMAKILVADEKNFSSDKRKKFLAKIATGDWDIVVIPEGSFEMIGVTDELFKDYMGKEIERLRAAKEEMKAKGSRITVKNIEKSILKLEEKLKEKLDQTKKDDLVKFEELGVDALFVDEADKFKNLSYSTEKQGIRGMGTQEGSNKASDLMMKLEYLRKKNAKIMFATGTPISNSMVEAYSMMRYLQPETLEENGLNNFDDWSNTFGKVDTASEVDVTGGRYKLVTRFRSFVNVPELMKRIKSVWDIQTAEMLEEQGILVKGVNLPLIKGGKPEPVILPASKELQEYKKVLIKRAEAIKNRKGPPQKGQDIMLTVLRHGLDASVDMRLIDPTLPADPNSKIEYAIRGIAEKYKKYNDVKGTQVVFIDRVAPDKTAQFNPHYYMKKKLIEGGIPEKEIAFIHDFPKDSQKEELYEKVNSGEIRVIFGSTEKLGAGTNIQERLAVLWHLDITWRPRDIEQREGRIIRPGNLIKEVEIYRLATKGSLDTFMYQLLEAKAKSIEQLLSGKAEERSVEEDDINEYEAIKSLSSENPLVQEKAVVDRDVRNLRALQNAYIAERAKSQQVLKNGQGKIDAAKKIIDIYDKFAANRPEKPTKDNFQVKINNTLFEDKKQALDAILKNMDNIGLNTAAPVKIGEYVGYPLFVQRSVLADKVHSYMGIEISKDPQTFLYGNVSLDPVGTFASLDSSIFGDMAVKKNAYQETVKMNEDQIKYAQEVLDKGFPKQKELEEKTARQIFINQELQKNTEGKELPPENLLNNESGQVQLPGVDWVAAVTKDAINIVSPRAFVPREALDKIMKMKGSRDQLEFELEVKLRKIEDFFDKMPRQDQIAFIDRIKTGQPQPDPRLQDIADMMRTIEDKYWAEAKQYKQSLAYKDDHYRVLWKVIPGQAEGKPFKGLFRRPLMGSRGFTKKATLVDMSEGIAKGGVPVSYNPMSMWRMSLVDMQKFITAQRMWKALKDLKYVKFVRFGGKVPEGFAKLNDSISKVFFPVEEGLVNAGEYYVEENSARILNNYLGRDLVRESNLGKGLLAIKNVTTSIELSISPFHAAYESISAMAASVGLGAQKVFNRGIGQANIGALFSGIKDIGLGVSGAAPVTLTRTGEAAIRFASSEQFLNTAYGKSFIKEFPDAKQLIEELFTGGMKLAMHQDYKINSMKAFREGIKNKEPWAIMLSSIPAANELIMKPIFEYYIPRLKVGLALKEYSHELVQRSAQLASGRYTREQLAREVWDSIENRFGEMNFDNLFWDRTFKSAMQLLIRSVTWTLGALKNVGAGVPKQILELKDAVEERRLPYLGRDMGWLLGIAVLVTLFSDILMRATIQEDPKDIKDIMFPRFNKEGDRMNLNTHLKDWLHIWHSPVRFVQSKLTGELGRIFDLWNNKDFFNTEIYHPGDPMIRQFMDGMKYLFPTPFSISNYKQLSQKEAPALVKGLSASGVAQIAPKYVTNTPAEEAAFEIFRENMSKRSRTKQEFERSQLKSQLKYDYANTHSREKIDQAIKDGKITREEARDIIKNSDVKPLVSLTKHMTYIDVDNILLKANDEEKKILEPILLRKVRNKLDGNDYLSHDERRRLIDIKKRLIGKKE